MDAEEPEMADFLQRMKGWEAPAEVQSKWESLPPLMRSAGDNPLSAWVKYTCEGRAYYKRRRSNEGSLAAQNADTGDSTVLEETVGAIIDVPLRRPSGVGRGRIADTPDEYS